MLDPAPRPEVMALLFDTNFKRPADSLVFRHLDGRLFTAEEQRMLNNATAEELQAAGVYVHNPVSEAEEKEAGNELIGLLVPYAIEHSEALIPFMTHEEVMKYYRLGSIITADRNRRRSQKD